MLKACSVWQFTPHFIAPHRITHDASALFFHNELLLTTAETPFLTFGDIPATLKFETTYYLGLLNNKPLYAVELIETQLPHPLTWVPIKHFLENIEAPLFHLICRARQLLYWHYISQYCSACGAKTQHSTIESAKICPHCQRILYPNYSVAIMVLIERANEILLARSPHFREGIYSLIAGFIEPGESAEQAVKREVKEEVGIAITNIRFFGTQNWPFPHSFMLAYRAQYASGDITIDATELESAQWFTIHNLPPLPYQSSIAKQLIDSVIQENM